MTENDLNSETENDEMIDPAETSGAMRDETDDEIEQAEIDVVKVDEIVVEGADAGDDVGAGVGSGVGSDVNADIGDDVGDETTLPPLGNDWQIGDIDAALAAVASLSEIMPEGEAEAEARADANRSTPTFVPEMPMPPLMTLRRGQLGSVVPALLLIGVGAWLTLVTTTGNAPDPLLVAVVIVGGIVLSLLAEWIGTGRWSRGAVFFALLTLLIAGVVALALQPNGINLAQGYPLLVTALGVAVLLGGVIARPINGRLIAPGVLLIVAGLVGLVVTLKLIPTDVLKGFAPFLPVVLAVVVIIGLLPLVFRRR